MMWLSNTCEKHGKGDDLYAYINWVDLHRQKEKYKDKRRGTEGREGKGEAETAGFVSRYPAPVVERG